MTLLTNVAPIILGFVAKLFALKSQAASENQKLMIQSLQVRNDSIKIWLGIEQTRKVLWLQ